MPYSRLESQPVARTTWPAVSVLAARDNVGGSKRRVTY
jgi:hypothetical protein